jgi:hypothetical protein
MILSVSTVKDSVSNVEKFVRRNLAGGVDHVLVFLDGPLPDVEDLLSAHPHATWVPAHSDWWVDGPSDRLNERQRINASMTGQLLADLPWAEWVFHIDGDEVVQLDRELMAGLEADCRSVRVAVREAVSRPSWDGDPTWFKRLLEPGELVLLTTLGLIDEPENTSYFRGHTGGKVGIRPSTDYGLGIHWAFTRDGRRLPALKDERLRLLHYESPDGEEFVRKWMALLGSGRQVRQRSSRGEVAEAIGALLERDLPQETTAAFLTRLYERTAMDDFETLQRLGFLEQVDPDAGSWTPEPLSDDARADLDALVARMRTLPKRPFAPPSRVGGGEGKGGPGPGAGRRGRPGKAAGRDAAGRA